MTNSQLVAGTVALVGAFVIFGARKSAAQPSPDQSASINTGDSMGETMGFYNSGVLSDVQKANADLIIAKAQSAGLDPAFMLALAVTESSLRAAIVGDDGISVGLFQMNLKYLPGESLASLQDAGHNADLAMTKMSALIQQFPGYTFGDYAEAWTLGGAGRFSRGKRNPRKLVSMQNAITTLGLALDLQAGPA